MGRAIAERFARDGGAALAADVNEAAVNEVAARLRDEGHRAVGMKVDVTDVTEVRAMVARAVQEFGGVDVLVNNAGILRPTIPPRPVS
jgi:NAD(P)-dependent dehydrogenase (short-subunit alcohol dehydrogenase family)